MAKLINTREADRFGSYAEQWGLDNNLRLNVTFSEQCQIFISSSTGDVADQIYEILQNKELFKEMKLISIACWIILLDKIYLKEFMNEVEKIDVSTLKEGKSY